MIRILLLLLASRKAVENIILKALKPQKKIESQVGFKTAFSMLMMSRAVRAKNEAAYFSKLSM